MSRPVPFFATRSDMLQLLQDLEQSIPVKYTLAGMFDQPLLQAFHTAESIPALGTSLTGDHVQDPTYLISHRDDEIRVREVPQRRGGIRYAVDQRVNPHTLGFTPGGSHKDEAVIAGQMGTSTGDPASDSILRQLQQRMKKRWKRVQSYLVGPEALNLLDQGYRLTQDIRSQSEYDLRRSHQPETAVERE